MLLDLLNYLLFPPTYVNDKVLTEKLINKTILITGASFGIGETLAYRLASLGANLILVARTEEKLQVVQQNILNQGGKAIYFAADLTQTDAIQQLLSFIHEQTPCLDIFISNAGKSIRRPVMESLDRFHDITRTNSLNYLAPVQLLLGLIPLLQRSKGHFINISAVNVWLPPSPNWSAYQASKTAFDQWLRCAIPELAAQNISVSTFYLPLVKTRMIAPTQHYQNLPAMTTPQVADWVCKALISPKQKYMPYWLQPLRLITSLITDIWEYLARITYQRK